MDSPDRPLKYGGDALRELAIDSARRALLEAGFPLASAADPLAADLVAVLEHYDLPLSVLVSFVHFRPKNPPLSADAFAKHCAEYRTAANQLRYDGSEEPRLCPTCHSFPMHRQGGYWVCAGGRCAPHLAA